MTRTRINNLVASNIHCKFKTPESIDGIHSGRSINNFTLIQGGKNYITTEKQSIRIGTPKVARDPKVPLHQFVPIAREEILELLTKL